MSQAWLNKKQLVTNFLRWELQMLFSYSSDLKWKKNRRCDHNNVLAVNERAMYNILLILRHKEDKRLVIRCLSVCLSRVSLHPYNWSPFETFVTLIAIFFWGLKEWRAKMRLVFLGPNRKTCREVENDCRFRVAGWDGWVWQAAMGGYSVWQAGMDGMAGWDEWLLRVTGWDGWYGRLG